MFVRSKVVKGRTYYQMVEGYRDELGRVRHRNVVGLGRSATVEEALRVERRRLASARRERSRYPGVATIAGKTTMALVERLDRQVADTEARVERLKSILAGDVPSVDTTVPKIASVDTTPPADRKPVRRRKGKLDDAHLLRLVALFDRAPDLYEEIGSPKATDDWDETRLAALRDAFDRFEARVS